MKNLIYASLFMVFSLGTVARADFNSLSEDDKKIAIDNYTKYKSLADDRKQSIQENWKKFESFSPEAKSKIEKKFVLFKKLSSKRRSSLVSSVERHAKIQNAKVIEKRVERPLIKRIERRLRPKPPAPTTTPAPRT